MDWALAIERNREPLLRIVAGLFAMIGLGEGKAVARLPGPLYRAVLGVLRPAESAVRRLIVIAARGLVVKPSPARPMPKGLAIARKRGGGRLSFQLFDTRKRFTCRRREYAKAQPRIRVIEFVQVFQPKDFASPPAVPEPKQDVTMDAQRLGRRLAAVKMALDDLPGQALRMARWQARRERTPNPKFTSPLRPGPPPGHRKMAEDEIDWVLRKCHDLAWHTLNRAQGAGYEVPRSGIP